jgi:hypothetical protein
MESDKFTSVSLLLVSTSNIQFQLLHSIFSNTVVPFATNMN